MVDKKLASRLFGKVGGERRRPRRGVTLRPQPLLLEERMLLARLGATPLSGLAIPIPSSNPRVDLSKIFWNGEPAPLAPKGGFPNVPSPASVGAAKTITITNSSNSTIYPFLRGQNNGADPHSGNQWYDPQDVHGDEFRQYIGYSLPSGNTFFGLPSGASITFQVPLALWDGDNLFIATDGKDLTTSNIFGYDPKASVAIARSQPISGTTWVQGSSGFGLGRTPLVMFYHSTNAALTLPNDAPAQLTEITFRDQYLTHFITDVNQTFPLINYDVSYVNNMVAPVSMEASHVPITYQTKPAPQPPTYYGYQDYGWLATNRNTATFEGAMANFINNTGGASVGQYFGGRGWPRYYNPTAGDLVIPSGANVFANSPLNPGLNFNIHLSSYDPNRWLLTSNGSAPINAGGGGYGPQGFVHADSTRTIYLGPTSAQFASDLQEMLKAGTVNVTLPGSANVLATVNRYVPNPPAGGQPYVVLNSPISATPTSGGTFAFQRPVSDYAVTHITDLWYSWAQYYVQQSANFADETIAGTLSYTGSDPTNVITLASAPRQQLLPGMQVSAPGLPAGTTIVKVDGAKIHLSRIAAAGAEPNQVFTFSKPTALKYDPAYTTPYTLSFDADHAPGAKLFAASVYEAMYAEAAVAPLPFSYLPDAMNVVSQVIQFYAKLPDYELTNGPALVADVRDVVKSVLRGVYDYNAVPDQSKWYPNPATVPDGLTSKQNFNVFNLDPYVWFVHNVQGMSAYGFSVDDDVSNPTATGPLLAADGSPNHSPNNLQIDFGGTQGLKNPSQWYPTVPWGTLQAWATIGTVPEIPNNPNSGKPMITIVGRNSVDNFDALTIYNQINNPGTGQVGATITASPGYFKPGTTLTFKGPVSGTDPQILLSQAPNRYTSRPIPVTITGQLYSPLATSTNGRPGPIRPVRPNRPTPMPRQAAPRPQLAALRRDHI